MPFRAPDDCPVHVSGYELIPSCLASANEIVRGDALFVEVGRRDGNLLVLLVDVMGHGPNAYQIVQQVQQILSDPANQNLAPATLFQRLNAELAIVFLTSGHYVAAIAALLDSLGHITVCNAGLPHPWIGSSGTAWVPWSATGGTLLGIGEEEELYTEDSRSLSHQELFLAITDGVTEAGQSQGAIHRFPLAAFMAGLPSDWPCYRIVLRLVESLQTHVALVSHQTQTVNPWPNDDVTILGVQRV